MFLFHGTFLLLLASSLFLKFSALWLLRNDFEYNYSYRVYKKNWENFEIALNFLERLEVQNFRFIYIACVFIIYNATKHF
jgi:hypothetical protein